MALGRTASPPFKRTSDEETLREVRAGTFGGGGIAAAGSDFTEGPAAVDEVDETDVDADAETWTLGFVSSNSGRRCNCSRSNLGC